MLQRSAVGDKAQIRVPCTAPEQDDIIGDGSQPLAVGPVQGTMSSGAFCEQMGDLLSRHLSWLYGNPQVGTLAWD